METGLRYDDELLSQAKPVYRTWEASRPCVVLGQSGRPDRDVNIGECERLGVPILRRSSGGGAVVLAPGCLNYTLIFPLESFPHLANVKEGMTWIMERIRQSLNVGGLTLEGDSDLALNGRKVSGNAQRRTKSAILHHGTLLYGFDPALPARLLKPPPRQPAYRAHRPDSLFLANLPRNCVKDEWNLARVFPGLDQAR